MPRFVTTTGERPMAGSFDLGGNPIINKVVTVNDQANNYTLVLGDVEKLIHCSKASAQTLTIPPNSAVAFPIGSVVYGMQYGAGQVTITAGAGVTLRATGGKVATTAQYSTFKMTKLATDEWVAEGSLS